MRHLSDIIGRERRMHGRSCRTMAELMDIGEGTYRALEANRYPVKDKETRRSVIRWFGGDEWKDIVELNFTEMIRKVYRASGMSGTEFARSYGSTPSQFCNWYAGRSVPSKKSFERFMDVYGSRMEEL